MTEDVIFSISGMQFDVDSESPLEVITVGNYYQKNGKHYVLFTETEPETGEETKNIVKIGKNRVDVIKRGSNNTHMVFETDKKHMSYYNTPFGDILVGIDTLKIVCEEQNMKINTKIDYALEVNFNHLSDCTIEMNITSKADTGFRLQ